MKGSDRVSVPVHPSSSLVLYENHKIPECSHSRSTIKGEQGGNQTILLSPNNEENIEIIFIDNG